MQIAHNHKDDDEGMEENGVEWRYFAANVLVVRDPIGILC